LRVFREVRYIRIEGRLPLSPAKLRSSPMTLSPEHLTPAQLQISLLSAQLVRAPLGSPFCSQMRCLKTDRVVGRSGFGGGG
jgi:hypothetical protein